jgi:hypothetical protein
VGTGRASQGPALDPRDLAAAPWPTSDRPSHVGELVHTVWSAGQRRFHPGGHLGGVITNLPTPWDISLGLRQLRWFSRSAEPEAKRRGFGVLLQLGRGSPAASALYDGGRAQSGAAVAERQRDLLAAGTDLARRWIRDTVRASWSSPQGQHRRAHPVGLGKRSVAVCAISLCEVAQPEPGACGHKDSNVATSSVNRGRCAATGAMQRSRSACKDGRRTSRWGSLRSSNSPSKQPKARTSSASNG